MVQSASPLPLESCGQGVCIVLYWGLSTTHLFKQFLSGDEGKVARAMTVIKQIGKKREMKTAKMMEK